MGENDLQLWGRNVAIRCSAVPSVTLHERCPPPGCPKVGLGAVIGGHRAGNVLMSAWLASGAATISEQVRDPMPRTMQDCWSQPRHLQ
jgi:hypothetical protein